MQKDLKHFSEEELIVLFKKRDEVLLQELKSNDEKIDKAQFRTPELESLLAEYKRIVDSQKRERFEGNNNQMSLPFKTDLEQVRKQEEEIEEKLSFERRKRKSAHQGRMPLPDHLPVEEIEIYPEEDITDMVCIGKEITEELEYEPAKYYIKRYIRYKYAPKNKEGVFIGELPNRVIEKGIPGAGLLASILVDK